MNFARLRHVHFTGIKGVGMTALSLCFKDMGVKVTGSDTNEVFVTDETLKKNNIHWKIGFGEKNLNPKPDLVITTAAHGGLSNIEIKKASELRIPVSTYAQTLADLSKTKELIAVCGVGGKTTTSSIFAVLLNEAKLSPSFVIGVGNIKPIGVPGKFSKIGKHFICEADDYVVSPGIDNTPKFMLLSPKVLVVTNIEYDHPDIYKSFDQTKEVFKNFIRKIPNDGLLVACIDNENVCEIIKNLKVPLVTYGFSQKADWQINNVSFRSGKTKFSLISRRENIMFNNLELNIPGKFNIQNAAAAFIGAKFIGLNKMQLSRGLKKYLGCRRRFEKMGKYKKTLFYDDYAHHPKEISSTLEATREWFPEKRIIAIFQPHTYSRTKGLLTDFSKSFKDADVVGFMDIYASARETKDNSISSEILYKETKKNHANVNYLGNHTKTVEWLRNNIKKNDVVITMGAGDIFHIYKDLFK